MNKSDFKENILKPIYEKDVLKLPYVKADCNVAKFNKTDSGNAHIEFYKLTEDDLYYFAFGQWNKLPDIEYRFKRDCFYFCVEI